MTSHPIDAVIDGMVAAWRDAPELAFDVDGEQVQLRVTDDPLTTPELDDRRLLFVGTSAQYLPGGAQGSTGYDLAGQRVQVDVTCELHVWSGDTDAAAERRQAFGVLLVLEQLLARARDLGGFVDWARVVRTSYEPDQTDQGAKAIVEFTVRVDATREHPE